MKVHRHAAIIKEWLDNGMPQVQSSITGSEWYNESSSPQWLEKLHYRLVYPPKPKKQKQIKMLCWFTGVHLYWVTENAPVRDCWIRVPVEDKLIETEE